ncbi:MAG: hypothetical protein KAT70_02935, partial [Thermoplasmata archaeon]|nr:hypothetical protein [Thermoplasmata archaeon]
MMGNDFRAGSGARHMFIMIAIVAALTVVLLLVASDEASATPDGTLTVVHTIDNGAPGIVNIGDELTIIYDDNFAATPTVRLAGGTVTADLSAYGGGAAQPLFDDGVSGGDAAIDDMWTLMWTVSNPVVGLEALPIVLLNVVADDLAGPTQLVAAPITDLVLVAVAVDTVKPTATGLVVSPVLITQTNNVLTVDV